VRLYRELHRVYVSGYVTTKDPILGKAALLCHIRQELDMLFSRLGDQKQFNNGQGNIYARFESGMQNAFREMYGWRSFDEKS